MKTKHILALVTFVAAFVISASLVALLFPNAVPQPRNVELHTGCKTTTAKRIFQLLQSDVKNGSVHRHLDSNQRGLASRTESYVSASERLGYEDLPMDFQTAWQKHMQAWRKQANLYNTLESDDFDDEAIEEMSARNTEEINRSWYEVLRIAQAHGAMIPKGAL